MGQKKTDSFFDQFDDIPDEQFFNSFESEPQMNQEQNLSNLKEANKIPIKEPTTFVGGFLKSISPRSDHLKPGGATGEAFNTGMQGGLGFAQGSIPHPIDAIKGIGNAIAHPIDAASSALQGLKELPSNVMNTTMQAGSEPEQFGRMMGEMTGQPLATAGLAKGIPYVPSMAVNGLKMAGTPAAAVGGMMERFQPLSGFMPRFADMRSLRTIERLGGRGIRNIGEKMKGLNTPESLSPTNLKNLPSKIFKESKTENLPPPNASVKDSKIVPNESKSKLKIRLDANGKFINTETGEQLSGKITDPWKSPEGIRLLELTDLERAGKLTAEQLKEAQILNKVVRKSDWIPSDSGSVIKNFNPEPPIKPNFQGNPSSVRKP
jgi:hypothetical protein